LASVSGSFFPEADSLSILRYHACWKHLSGTALFVFFSGNPVRYSLYSSLFIFEFEINYFQLFGLLLLSDSSVQFFRVYFSVSYLLKICEHDPHDYGEERLPILFFDDFQHFYFLVVGSAVTCLQPRGCWIARP